MYIKVYFDDKPVYLCTEIDAELKEILHHPDAVFIDELSDPAVKSLLHEIVKENFHAGVIWNADMDQLKKEFFKHFTLIEAAGGIVQNEKKELLFIHRLGKWDLPKGKIEKKETPDAAALREVTEETGVSLLTLKKKIGETYHTYDSFGKHFLKTTHWYYMTASGNEALVPQTEEQIDTLKWVKTKDIKEPMNDTYPSIRDVMRRFFDEP
jgi:8-oxo-dGTP pyrophosphatase MutT (NUDIX family)